MNDCRVGESIDLSVGKNKKFYVYLAKCLFVLCLNCLYFCMFCLYCIVGILPKLIMTVEQVYESVDLLVEKCTILEVSSVII